MNRTANDTYSNITTDKGPGLRVLFASFEAVPFIKTGGLGDVAGSLPAYIRDEGCDVRVVLPLLSVIPERLKADMTLLCSFRVQLGWRNQYCGLFSLRRGGVVYYFLDNEYYFRRRAVYGEYDDGERIAFFAKAAVESVRHIAEGGDGFVPDILHCNDWHTALSPVFLRELYRGEELYDRLKTVFTIHNLRFQGRYDSCMTADVLGLNGTPAEWQLMQDGDINFLKGAVIYSDMVTTVSETYAGEICTPQGGEGLDGLFRSVQYKLRGILNGIDLSEYDPSTDRAISARYDISCPERKLADKLALQRELGLREDPQIPLYGMVSRLTRQKGVDLLTELLYESGDRNMQVAVLGTGDRELEEALSGYAAAHSESCAVRIEFSEPLSRRFYAGADVFLMPSQFEPCGLSQMIAMRYGTLPLVRETGGLRDTVAGCDAAGENATGFTFAEHSTAGLRSAVDRSLELWNGDRETWRRLQRNAMSADNGWSRSAEEYRKIYRSLCR